MTFNVSDKYRQRVEELNRKHRGYFPIFDPNVSVECNFEVKRKRAYIKYKSLTESGEYTAPYNKIKRCMVYCDGLLVLFKDKGFVFLPVLDDKESDAHLVSLCEHFHEKFGEFRFETVQRLWILDPISDVGEKYHKGFDLFDSPKIIMVLAALVCLMGVFFIFERLFYREVEKTECIKYSGAYEEYYDDGDVEMVFSTGDTYWVEGECARGKFYERLDKIEKGQVLQLILHPDSESILEMRAGGVELVNFYESQEYMRKDANGFAIFGVILIVASIGLFLYGFSNYKREKSQLDEQMGYIA